MELNHKYENLNKIEVQIKFLTKSEIRLRILNCLKKKPSSIKDIVEETKLTYSSISSNMAKLYKKEYIYKSSGKYYINPICNIYLKNLLEFDQLIKLIGEFKTFWGKHILNEININSLREITDLNESELIESTPIDIYKPHNHMKNLISNSNEIKAIFPFLHPDYPKIIENLLEKNSKIEIIIPKSIESQLFENMDKNIVKEGIKNKKLKVKIIKENINLSLVINKYHMSLGLFKIDGSYDQNRLLTSKTPEAIAWASNLFIKINNTVF